MEGSLSSSLRYYLSRRDSAGFSGKKSGEESRADFQRRPREERKSRDDVIVVMRRIISAREGALIAVYSFAANHECNASYLVHRENFMGNISVGFCNPGSRHLATIHCPFVLYVSLVFVSNDIVCVCKLRR